MTAPVDTALADALRLIAAVKHDGSSGDMQYVQAIAAAALASVPSRSPDADWRAEKGEAEALLGEIGAGGSPAGLIPAIHNLIGMYEKALARSPNALTEALGPDAAGRPFPELLTTAADMLEGCGGGPVVDCLRIKAGEISAALARSSVTNDEGAP